MATVNQPSWAPTNKLTATMLAGLAFEFAEPVIDFGLEWVAESTGIPLSAGPYTNAFIQFSLMFAAGYIVRDRPNVVGANDGSNSS